MTTSILPMGPAEEEKSIDAISGLDEVLGVK